LTIEDAKDSSHSDAPIFKLGFVSVVAIPLKSKEKVLGTLTGASRAPRHFTQQDMELLTSIGNQLALAIENATLYSQTRAMVDQLKETDRFKSEFFTNISHELRTPLTSIIGYSELLLDEMVEQCNLKQGEYITNIQSSGTHLLEIISNLLDLSKIRAGKMEVHFGEFSIRNHIMSCIKTVTPLAAAKGQHLETKFEDGKLMINGDEVKVKQILFNLLSNAIKFTPSGGFITVEANSLEWQGQPAVKVSVIDTGIGIKPEDSPMIFEEFRQADSSYTRQYPGTGLGLPIVKQFVEMHGGQLEMESQFGKGSRFTFYLPSRIEPEKSEVMELS
jgi:signal transduction histidine kinase